MKQQKRVTISSLIHYLSGILDKHGDLEVFANDGWGLIDIARHSDIFVVGRDDNGEKVACVMIRS